jgi:hypothetical protein
MVGVAQDAQGETRLRPIVEDAGARFPVLIDRASKVAGFFGFQITPSGVFVDPDGVVRYVHGSAANQFDVADPRVRMNLDLHLAGRTPHPVDFEPRISSEAMGIFGEGANLFAAGETGQALEMWRRALALDPDNFLIRSQIWSAERPERFWPAVDRDWQRAQLLREGYDKPLP